VEVVVNTRPICPNVTNECTHFTDTFDSKDHVYVDGALGAKVWAENHREQAIENADSITGYIATFDTEIK
jgi:hypothetical protein